MNIRSKFGDSSLNRSRDKGDTQFVTYDDDAGRRRPPHKAETPFGVLRKKKQALSAIFCPRISLNLMPTGSSS